MNKLDNCLAFSTTTTSTTTELILTTASPSTTISTTSPTTTEEIPVTVAMTKNMIKFKEIAETKDDKIEKNIEINGASKIHSFITILTVIVILLTLV